MCEAFNCLPGAGGLLDQDPYLLMLVRYYRIAASERDKREAEQAAKK